MSVNAVLTNDQRPTTSDQRLPVGQVCPICGGEGEPVGTVQGVCVRECCGTLLAWAWRDEEQYQDFYADISQFHEGQQETERHPTTIARDAEHLHACRSRVEILRALYPQLTMNPPVMILDVGAGGGSFVAACKEVRWDAYGIEPCAPLAMWARQNGRPVEAGGWQDIGGEWDVITLHDVIEHLTDPLTCLRYCRVHLHQGGLIVVEMPEWRSAQAEREGLNWRHILPKQHVALFSEWSARALFERAGLSVEAMVRPLRGSIGKIVFYLGRGGMS
jgi:2-polyprenyl-3-methyl-5-hydroxy-6-metoxy-1,4-benzoquinol methylase